MTMPAAETRVLIIGGTGMLGHKVWQVLRRRFDARVTVRRPDAHRITGLFDDERTIAGVDAAAFDGVAGAVDRVRPAVIVNCVGIVKQLAAARDPVQSITVNALFPHRLAQVAGQVGARLIHISTDCVFSGRRGNYAETDAADAEDLYGRTKLLGEVTGPGCLTLRTSMIGRELSSTSGLVEWFLAQRGSRVMGYTRAVFSGLTTRALAELIAETIERHPSLSGLYHVASEPITKYDLLSRLKEAYRAAVDIVPSDEVCIDRSLDGSRFRASTGLAVPSWDAMIRAMAGDSTPYEEWRSTCV